MGEALINRTERQPQFLMVTGCYRSGTTLLEKVLHNHPQVICASQPFPVLYFFVKELFHRAKGLTRRYPLEHLFLEDGYSPEELRRFLEERILTTDELDSFWEQMAAYTQGLWTPEMMQFRGSLKPGCFWDIYAQLNECIRRLFPKNAAKYLGGKEVLVEEYIPHLLRRGVKVVNVIRDPRGMIASLNFRERDNLTGEDRPVLYSLRAWRKSVAISLACEGEPNFLWLRYEDFIRDFTGWMGRLIRFLGIEPYPANAFNEGIYDQWGKLWQGNSSFQDNRGVSDKSLTAFSRKLPREVLAYIETVCLPEMKFLNYERLAIEDFSEAVVADYRDPFARIHFKFASDYSHSPERVEQEVKRYRLLTGEGTLTQDEARRWFINEATFRRHIQDDFHAVRRTETDGADRTGRSWRGRIEG